MFLVFLKLLSMVVFVQGDRKCYDDIGCVTNDPPYQSLTRPVSIFPQSPESINTQFFLFTVKNTEQYQVVSAKNRSTLYESNFHGNRSTVIITHGYTEKGNDPWPVKMCQTILQVEDVNCICVDWSGGSSAIYFQAINNVQVVGAEIAFFINTIVEIFNCSLSVIHLIGHSLGAQAVGEAGKRRPGIAKISILDAARPGFEHESDEVSIDPTDANFVMAIHTDAGLIGLGMKKLIGHKDFFPNGGKLMTGCDGSQILDLGKATSLIGAFRDTVICNHVASYYMFLSTILTPGGFMGYCASNYSSFQEGAGFPCFNSSCSLMGYYTEPGNMSFCREYYLNTGPRFNYNRWRYRVTVQMIGSSSIYVSIKIALYNSSDFFDRHTIYSGSIIDGRKYSAFLDSVLPSPIIKVTFTWKNLIPLPLAITPLGAESVTLTHGNDGAQYKFCGGETTREDITQTLNPCP